MTTPSTIHNDPDAQHVDVRMYFPADLDPAYVLDIISNALQAAPDLYEMISAYQLVNDGFAHLTPADQPLA